MLRAYVDVHTYGTTLYRTDNHLTIVEMSNILRGTSSSSLETSALLLYVTTSPQMTHVHTITTHLLLLLCWPEVNT